MFFNMKVCCVFSLESSHRGDSNECTQYTIFQYKKENRPKLFWICTYGIFSKGLKNELETVMVNEPSEFELLKFSCIYSKTIRMCFKSNYGKRSGPISMEIDMW